MPRKKLPPKFKYTARKNGELFVRFPVEGVKYPVWRKCPEETQKAVDEIIEEMRADRARVLTESAVPDRCDKFFDFWLASVKNHVSERTFQNREAVIRLYLKPALGFFALSEIKPVQLSMIYQAMLDAGLQPVTIKKTHTVLSAIFKEALAQELIKFNPASRVKPPKVVPGLKTKAMDARQAQRFLAACQTAPNGIIFEFALETGMRSQEYLALRWSDINFDQNTVQVVRALVYDRKGGGFFFKAPKTVKSRRTIPLSKHLCRKLENHKTAQNEYLAMISERIGRKCKPSRESRREHNKTIVRNHKELNLIFPSKHGTPLKDINLGRRYFKPIAKTVGLDESLSLYSLRHTSFSLLMKAGVNIKVIAERAGHHSTSFTMDTYVHLLEGMEATATNALTTILYDSET